MTERNAPPITSRYRRSLDEKMRAYKGDNTYPCLLCGVKVYDIRAHLELFHSKEQATL